MRAHVAAIYSGKASEGFPVQPQADVDGCAPALILNLHEVITISGAGPASAGSEKARAGVPLRESLRGNNLDTVICLSYTRLRPTDTHMVRTRTHVRAPSGETRPDAAISTVLCYDIALKELIECIKGVFFFFFLKYQGGRGKNSPDASWGGCEDVDCTG